MSGEDAQELVLTDRSIYKSWVSHTIRFSDLDPLGHLNNAIYATFMEAGRIKIVHPLTKKHGDGNLDIVIARLTIDFRRELTYPGIVDIGTSIKRVGHKSVVFVNGVFKQDSDECAATSVSHMVFFDLIKRASAVPPPVIRKGLSAYTIE